MILTLARRVRDLLELTLNPETPDVEWVYPPFAIALKVREAWGDHLAGAFFATTVQR